MFGFEYFSTPVLFYFCEGGWDFWLVLDHQWPSLSAKLLGDFVVKVAGLIFVAGRWLSPVYMDGVHRLHVWRKSHKFRGSNHFKQPLLQKPKPEIFRCFICHVPCVFLLLCFGKHYFPSIIKYFYFQLLFPIYLFMISHLFVHSSPNIAMIYHPLNAPHMIPMRTCPWFYIERPSYVRWFMFTHLTLTIVIPYPAEAYQSWVIAVGNPKSCQACRLVYIFIPSP